MKRKLLLGIRFAAVFCSLAAILCAADFTGTWKGTIVRTAGEKIAQTIVLKQEGNSVTGTAGARSATPIADGKVDGDVVTFTTTRMGNGIERKTTFTGKISGDEIKMRQEISGINESSAPIVMEYTLKRAGN